MENGWKPQVFNYQLQITRLQIFSDDPISRWPIFHGPYAAFPPIVVLSA